MMLTGYAWTELEIICFPLIGIDAIDLYIKIVWDLSVVIR